MIITIAVILAVFWAAIIFFLAAPAGIYRNTFNRVTSGKWQRDRAQLQIMLDHLRSFPEQWNINSSGASFPREGNAKQIYISQDNNGWNYTLNNFSSNSRSLEGHFGHEFAEAINRENDQQVKTALLRDFYPKLNGQVLLGGSK